MRSIAKGQVNSRLVMQRVLFFHRSPQGVSPNTHPHFQAPLTILEAERGAQAIPPVVHGTLYQDRPPGAQPQPDPPRCGRRACGALKTLGPAAHWHWCWEITQGICLLPAPRKTSTAPFCPNPQRTVRPGAHADSDNERPVYSASACGLNDLALTPGADHDVAVGNNSVTAQKKVPAAPWMLPPRDRWII